MSHLSWVTVTVICLLLPFVQLQAASEWSPLLRATFSGDLNTVRSLLDEGRNINQRDDEGSTPLMVAASKGHIAIVRELLSRGAGVNLRNDYGWTPLMMATAGRNAEIVKLLLARGADPEIQNRDGKNTLEIAKSVGLEHLFHAVGKAPSPQREHRLTQRQQKTPVQRQQQISKQHQQLEAELAQQKPSQVEQLLARANQQVKALRLTLPAGDNALESYRQVLELEPGNAEAKAGLVRIAERYEQLARRRQATGELETSLEYIARGLQVLPEDETLLALRQAVQEAQTKAEQQQDEAKQQQAQAEQQLAEAERQRRQVAQLLEQAESQLAAWRLTTPSKDNAWESYQQVLALEPGNPKAKAGLVRIAERYAKLARRRQKAGELEKTQEYIARGLQVLPQDEALLALQGEVQAGQAEEEHQRGAEQRRRQVAELLRQADKQLAAQQLTEPAGNNAWESYRQVLELAPGNGQAEAGLAGMAEHYGQLARQRREAGELAASLAAVETGLQIRPQDKTLLALQEEVQAAQAEVEQQRAAAERRRRQVAELLRQADKQLAAQQLTEPAGNNAWESYRQVLELAPG